MASLLDQMLATLEPLKDLQWAAIGFPKDLDGAYTGTLGEWRFMEETVHERFHRCRSQGRIYYELASELPGPAGPRSVASALCLSKRLLLARAEAALLLGLMLAQNAPEADADLAATLTPEMLSNGTGLMLTRLATFEDLRLDWLVLGAAKCGTTSLQYNLGLHPQLRLKSTHSATFSHAFLYSSSRFLPAQHLQREFFNRRPCELSGHPDQRKGSPRELGSPPELVGCSLVADLTPMYEDGTGDLLSNLSVPEARPEHFLFPFLLSSLLRDKPRLKLLYAVRDPLECFLSLSSWRQAPKPWCFQEDLGDREAASQCWQNVGHCRLSQALDLACSLSPTGCTRGNLGLLLVGQTSEQSALAAAAEFLGAERSFFEDPSLVLRSLNRAREGRHERQVLCRPELTALRDFLRRLFRAEYTKLAERLSRFELLKGSAEELLEMEKWKCPDEI